MVVGKILPVDQVDENRESDPTAVPTEPSLPFASRVNTNLGDEDRERTVALLNRYLRCFAASPHEFGRSNVVKHVIDTGNHLPVHQTSYASAWRERELINDQIQTMMRDNVIVPSNSAWAAPVVLVRKKDGEWLFCVDYRRLNAVTTKDVYPLPRIDDALSRMEGSRYFSILDMQVGYWQVDRGWAVRVQSDAVRVNKCAGHVPTNDGCRLVRPQMEFLPCLFGRHRRLRTHRIPTSRASRIGPPTHQTGGVKIEVVKVLIPRAIP
jgi:hypothetical protein